MIKLLYIKLLCFRVISRNMSILCHFRVFGGMAGGTRLAPLHPPLKVMDPRLGAIRMCVNLQNLMTNARHKTGHSLICRIVFTACRCDPPFLSNRPSIEAVLIRFWPSQFSSCNVKSMANNGERDNVLKAACRSQGVLILIQHVSHPRLPHVKIWQRYIQ